MSVVAGTIVIATICVIVAVAVDAAVFVVVDAVVAVVVAAAAESALLRWFKLLLPFCLLC